MLTRSKSTSTAAGQDVSMDSDKFKIFFLEALSDDAVVKKQQAVLRPVVDRLSNALDEIVKSNQILKERLEEKDAEIGALNKQVATLELKVDAMEQWGRKGSVRIHGLSEDTEGTVEQKVLDLVNNGMKLRPPLTLDEIEVAHRLPGGRSQARRGPQRGAASPGPSCRAHDGAGGDDDGNNDGEDHGNDDGEDDGNGGEQISPPPPPKSVIVKFVSRKCKARVMAERKKRKILKNPRPIYIQDDLTALRAKIAFMARQLRNQGKINDTWIFDSRVLVKDLHNRIKHVNCLSDLNAY